MIRKAYSLLPRWLQRSVSDAYMLVKRMPVGSGMFSSVIIEISTACNLNTCRYCPNSTYPDHMSENNRQMPDDMYHKIIDELGSMEFRGEINFSFYNESLLDSRILHLVEYAHENCPKAKIVLVTNGTLLTRELFKSLIERGCRKFQITQHREYMEHNMVLLFRYLGLNLDRIMADVRRRDLNFKVHEAVIHYVKYGEDSPMYNRGGLVSPKKVNHSCIQRRKGWVLVVNADGDVILCCQDYFSQHKFGNLRYESVMEAWNGPAFKAVRDKIIKGRYELPICKKCTVES